VRILGSLIGIALIVLVLLDTFETIIQPRRVTHRFRLARFYYRTCWDLCSKIALVVPAGKRREAYLSFFGPLSVLGLFVIWICALIFGFAVLAWSVPERIQTVDTHVNFFDYLYMSGTTIFTLGYGDVVPLDHFGRTLAVCESGLGFAFLAIVISYLPGINQAFSRREVTISLLDARAGSPPSAAQLLSRVGKSASMPQLDSFLAEWEAWSAELLESHLSFPILTFFRSQHDNQSWLAAITCMLDTCAVMLAELKDCNVYRAQLTFAMARHAVVDLALVFRITPEAPKVDRLPEDKCRLLQQTLRGSGLEIYPAGEAAKKIRELRAMYEPFVNALAKRFLLTLPPFITDSEPIDNWQRSPGFRAPGLEKLPTIEGAEDHFGG
jgi:hypothetical protein